MRDKVEHMREEVNVVSRRRDKFATNLIVWTTLELILREERSRPISKQYNPCWHILRGLCARNYFGPPFLS
jgi:hypothetical protein